MNALTPTETLSHTVPIRLRGRLFPNDPRLPSLDYQSTPELNGEEADRLLSEQLAEQLWEWLPYAKVVGSGDAAMLAQKYVESLGAIQKFQEEVNRLVVAVCETVLEFRQKGPKNQAAQEEALKAKRAELIERAQLRPASISNVLTAELVCISVPKLHEKLAAALRADLHTFTCNFFELLARLVDQRLAGLVTWQSQNVCAYHFFKEIILQENQEMQTTRGAIKRRARPGSNLRAERVQEVRETTTGRTVHSLARHEHHVLDAFWTTIGNSRVVMPLQVQKLVALIPTWLQPFVRVIDGTIIRERILETEYRNETWQQVTTYEEPVFGCEPGVVIGPFVLTGWGPREIDEELVRRGAESDSKLKRVLTHEALAARSRWKFAAQALVMASAAFIVWAFIGQPNAILLACLSAAACVYATFQVMIAARVPQPPSATNDAIPVPTEPLV